MITTLTYPRNTASPQLTIVVPTPLYGGSLPVAFHAADAFAELGHNCELLKFDAQYELFERLGNGTEESASRALKSRFAELLADFTCERAIASGADLVWFTAQSPVSVKSLQRLRAIGIKTAMWFVEDVRRFDYWRYLAPHFDAVFTIQTGDAALAIERAGAKCVEYLPCAANPKVHRPLTLTDADRDQFGALLSFVGAGYPNRVALFEQLNIPSLKLWGNDWPPHWQSRLAEKGRRVSTEETARIFNGSDINLNVHSSVTGELLERGDFVNPRTFEIAACGAFQLVNDQAPLRALFAEEEVSSFSTVQEMLELIEVYGSNPEARHRISTAARARVLREHTYAHRMESALKSLFALPIDTVARSVTTIGDLKIAVWGNKEFTEFLGRFDDTETATLAKLVQTIPSDRHMLTRSELIVLMMNEFRNWGVDKGVIK